MRILNIAIGFFKETVWQPVYFVLIVFFSLLIASTRILTLFGMGNEVRMIQEMGISSLTLAGLLIMLLAATQVISEESRSRTIVTLLSKPIHRWELIVGKYLGIFLVILCAYLILSAVFYLTLWWKGAGYLSLELPKAISLSFLQVLIISALSLAFSIFLPPPTNAVLCLILFTLGHLSGYIYGWTLKGGFLAKALGKIFYLLIPNLGFLDLTFAVGMGTSIPDIYIGWTFVYGMFYIGMALFAASLLLERREMY